MADHDLSIVGGDVVLAGETITRVDIGVRNGTITTLADGGIDATTTIDATGLTVLPGLIDQHFHVFWNYGWETYSGATRAAAKGGITTVVDMPLDNPPTLSAELFRAKLTAISAECHVDFALFAGQPETDPDELDGMVEAGAVALKLFTGVLAPPGMYPGADTGQLLDYLRRCARLGIVAVVHCENVEIVEFETARLQGERRTDVAAWDEARPWYSEVEAVERVALVSEVTECRTVIAHVSSPQSIEAVRRARARGVDLYAETCPHYLCLTTEEMAGDLRMKWNPPSRNRESVEWLWDQVADGGIHAIGTDHAPLPKDPGADIWTQLPGSGNGVELLLGLTATELVARGHGLALAAWLLSTSPARIMGLHPRKGSIQLGADADFAIVRTDGTRTIDPNELEYHNQEQWSPFEGREITVWPEYTVLRGQTIFAEGEVVGRPGDGQFLRPAERVGA